jgi:hypothetical protein
LTCETKPNDTPNLKGSEKNRSALGSRLFPEAKRQFAFGWLGDPEIDRRVQEKQT